LSHRHRSGDEPQPGLLGGYLERNQAGVPPASGKPPLHTVPAVINELDRTSSRSRARQWAEERAVSLLWISTMGGVSARKRYAPALGRPVRSELRVE
jgi:hypothetical protein